MVRDATDALGEADLVLLVVDAAEAPGPGLAFILGRLAEAGTAAILALNKIDLLSKERLLPMLDELSQRHDFRAIVPISAKTGDGMERLGEVLAANLPEGEPGYPEDFLTATPETEWIAEVIREKLLERTRDELPFAHAVVIESVKPAEGKDLTVVVASIVVERRPEGHRRRQGRLHDPRHRQGAARSFEAELGAGSTWS
jgi:GTP-binding protein Era